MEDQEQDHPQSLGKKGPPLADSWQPELEHYLKVQPVAFGWVDQEGFPVPPTIRKSEFVPREVFCHHGKSTQDEGEDGTSLDTKLERLVFDLPDPSKLEPGSLDCGQYLLNGSSSNNVEFDSNIIKLSMEG